MTFRASVTLNSILAGAATSLVSKVEELRKQALDNELSPDEFEYIAQPIVEAADYLMTMAASVREV